MSKRVRFIAETNGAGDVVWLWRVGVGERIAKPIKDPASHLDEVSSADAYGARTEVISDWLRRRCEASLHRTG
jgi:hypothetical protein